MMSKIDKIIQGMQAAKSPSDYWVASDIEFPELEASRRIIQRNSQSVREHTMSVIDLLTIKNSITLLSGLFHDLGKNCNQSISGSRFPGHAIESTKIARTRLTKWGATPYLIDRVIRIISMHMYDIKGITQEKTIRKFIADVGQDNIENWFVVRRADSASYSEYSQYNRHMIDPFYNAVKNYLSQLPQKDSPLQPQPESNIVMGGKDCKDDDVSLSVKGG